MAVYSDAQIAAFLAEAKPFPEDWVDALELKPKNNHAGLLQSGFVVTGAKGTDFSVHLTKEIGAPDEKLRVFSVVLGLHRKGAKRGSRATDFILRRYNGNAHEHTNRIEKVTFSFEYHIHTATERYQRTAFPVEEWAVVTNRYTTLGGAFECFVNDCGVILPKRDTTGELWS